MLDNQRPTVRSCTAWVTTGLRAAMRARQSWWHYGMAIAATLLTMIVDMAIVPARAETLLEIYLLPIFLSAYIGGLWPGVLATGLAAILTDYLFLEPINTPWIAANTDAIEWVTMVVLGLLISALSELLLRTRRQVEATLAEVEERFHLMVEEVQEYALLQITPDGMVASWNVGAERIKGYRADEIIGQPFERFYTPEDRARGWPAHLLNIAAAQGSVKDAGWRVTKNETQFWGEVVITALRDRAGHLVGFSKLTRDMTEPQRAAAILRQSEERYRQIVETSQEGIWQIDAENSTIFANARMAEILGYTVEEMIGAPLLSFMDAEGQAIAAANIARRHEGIAEQHDFKFQRKDGTEVWALLSTNPLTDQAGRYIGALAMITDITERKRAETALRRFSDRLQHLRDIDQSILADRSLQQIGEATVIHLAHLIACSRVSFFLVNREQQIVQAAALQVHGVLQTQTPSPMPLQILGNVLDLLTQGQVYHTTDLTVVPDLPPGARVALEHKIRADFVVPIMGNGELLGFLNIGSELPSAFGADDIDVARTVADQLSIAIQQSQLREQVALHAQELEQRVVARTAELAAANHELEAFSYSVSHDLRAPLRAIDGFSRILLEDYVNDLPEEAQHYFRLVRNNAQQMGRLVDDLLAFSRLSRQPLVKQMIEPANLVQQCLEDLRIDQEQRDLTITIEDLPACQADPALLKQVWINLLANALKYSRARALALITIGSRSEDGATVYSIQDNGVGFDMRYASQLFGVFQRMHRAEEYEGTGVGLAIVQRIITRHGGRIWAEAKVDDGAAFYFTLDRAVGGGEE
jgi:PAS domain S-box-containing protein